MAVEANIVEQLVQLGQQQESKREAELMKLVRSLDTALADLVSASEHPELVQAVAGLQRSMTAVAKALGAFDFAPVIKVDVPAPVVKVDVPPAQVRVDVPAPVVNVAAPAVNVEAPKPQSQVGSTWVVTLPGVDGEPARQATIKRTA